MSRGARVSILLDELRISPAGVSPTDGGLATEDQRFWNWPGRRRGEASAACGSTAQNTKTCPFCLAVSARWLTRR